MCCVILVCSRPRLWYHLYVKSLCCESYRMDRCTSERIWIAVHIIKSYIGYKQKKTKKNGNEIKNNFEKNQRYIQIGGVVVQLVGHWTCNT